MKTINNTPRLILKIGAAFISLSGIVSLAISIPIGAIYNNIDPYGMFGHIGIINGIAALIIGVLLFWLSRKNHSTSVRTIFTGFLSVVFGHIGAIAGALLVGTAGLLLCYFAGFWFIVVGIKRFASKSKLKNSR